MLKQIVVEAPIERAFSVFTAEFDAIKPRDHTVLAVELAETVLEPREGGRIYDRGVDGSECPWARVLAYEPPNRLVFSWDLNLDRHGEGWEGTREGVGSKGGWPLYLQRFAELLQR